MGLKIGRFEEEMWIVDMKSKFLRIFMKPVAEFEEFERRF